MPELYSNEGFWIMFLDLVTVIYLTASLRENYSKITKQGPTSVYTVAAAFMAYRALNKCTLM